MTPLVHCERCGTSGAPRGLQRPLGAWWCRDCMRAYDGYRRRNAGYLLRGLGVSALAIGAIIGVGTALTLPIPAVFVASAIALFGSPLRTERRNQLRFLREHRPALPAATVAHDDR